MNSKEWVAHLESSSALAGQDTSSLQEIAARAVRECSSVEVWSKYAEILLRGELEPVSAPKAASLPASARLEALERGLKQVGLWLDSSDRFWALYIAAVKIERPVEDVIEAYLARLAVPHVAIDKTFVDLSTYVSGNDNYEQIMTRASQLVAKTRRLLVERERWELAKPVAYENYLQWELERFSANARFDFCVPLFDRILTSHPHHSSTLWLRFVRHMWFHHSSEAWETVTRALVYFPTEPRLWTLKLRIACDQSDRERVLGVAEDAKLAGVNIAKTPAMLNTYSAWLANSTENGSSAIRELRILVEPVIFSPFVPIGQLSVLTEILANKNEVEIARKAWRKRAAASPRDAELWEAWVAFELSMPRQERGQGLMKLWKVYTHHCRVSEHPVVRRNVLRILTVNSAVADAEKVELAGESTIWVTRIPHDWDETSVREALRGFGPIVDVRYPPNRGFCYVQFETPDAAYTAEMVGVSGLHIQISDKAHKVRPPASEQKRLAASTAKHRKVAERTPGIENTLIFSGMQDATDMESTKQLIAKYDDAQVQEDVSRELPALKALFASDADAGRAQLSLNGLALPSGANLKASYA